MTHQQILTKAIEKAIANGWNPLGLREPGIVNVDHAVAPRGLDLYDICLGSKSSPPVWVIGSSSIIFNHDFVKALWPGEYGASGSVDPRAISFSTARPLIPTWQMRLMEMVLAEDPIAYLGEHL